MSSAILTTDSILYYSLEYSYLHSTSTSIFDKYEISYLIIDDLFDSNYLSYPPSILSTVKFYLYQPVFYFNPHNFSTSEQAAQFLHPWLKQVLYKFYPCFQSERDAI